MRSTSSFIVTCSDWTLFHKPLNLLYLCKEAKDADAKTPLHMEATREVIPYAEAGTAFQHRPGSGHLRSVLRFR